MLNFIVRRVLVILFACSPLPCFAQATEQTAQVPTSGVATDDLRRWLQVLSEWDRFPGDSYMSPASGDLFLRVLPEMRKTGAAAFSIAPGVAELLTTTKRNWSTLAQVLIEMTPPASPDEVASLVQTARANDATRRVLALARLAHSTKPEAIGALRDAARVYHDTVQRVTGTVALGYAGNVLPEIAATALAGNLRDRERSVRSSAANSLGRMCDALQTRVPEVPARIVGGFATDFLLTRDDPQSAVIVLGCLPLQAATRAKGPLQALVDDPTVADFNKISARMLLARLQAPN
jgi:hypothetical protein